MMRIEKITRKGKEFAVILVEDLQRLMDDAEMLADMKAYDAAKALIEKHTDGRYRLISVDAGSRGKAQSRYGGNTAAGLAKGSGVSRVMIAGRQEGGVHELNKQGKRRAHKSAWLATDFS